MCVKDTPVKSSVTEVLKSFTYVKVKKPQCKKYCSNYHYTSVFVQIYKCMKNIKSKSIHYAEKRPVVSVILLFINFESFFLML